MFFLFNTQCWDCSIRLFSRTVKKNYFFLFNWSLFKSRSYNCMSIGSCRIKKKKQCRAVCPFEPLQSSSLRAFLLKTALLLALASVKHVEDLQAHSINPACLDFGPNDSKFVQKQRLGYEARVLSTPFRAQVMVLSVLQLWWQSSWLYSQMPLLFCRAIKGCIAIGSRATALHWFVFLILHEPIDVLL